MADNGWWFPWGWRLPRGYERVYLPLYKVADTPFHIQGDHVCPQITRSYQIIHQHIARFFLTYLTIYPLRYLILISTHLKLCLAIATHNFKWLKITHNCLIWDETFANLDVWTLIYFTITVFFWSTNNMNKANSIRPKSWSAMEGSISYSACCHI